MAFFSLHYQKKEIMLVIYFFVGLIVLVAVWFVSFSYRKRRSQEVPKEKSRPEGNDDDVMYR
jgi:heme/copper-type cytochrome/quinol oxidase subunit 2